jgi:LCP family protein required for cell wall assembly
MAKDPTPRRLRRTWPQRLVLVGSALVAGLCFVVAGGVWYFHNQVAQVQRVTFTHASSSPVEGASGVSGTGGEIVAGAADLTAQNFLLTGSDSRSCIDPSSPYAGAFLANGDIGQRSDTIMLVRFDPNSDRAAILSFPRDLWVKIDGTNRSSKINSAYSRDDPGRIVRTIESDFQVRVDHYVDIDFCAFKNLVDAVGGVKIPFAYPTRDTNTGLNVPQPACVSFTGDAALAYARSRHYQWSTDGGKHWKEDGTSDYGRIARQQDFIRRIMQKVIDKGARQPSVARSLLSVALKEVRVDDKLTLEDLLKLSTRLKSFDPATVRSYRYEGSGSMIRGESVILPLPSSDTNKAVLSVFRGQAKLADAPDPNSLPSATTTTVKGAATTAPITAAKPLTTAKPTTTLKGKAVTTSGPTTVATTQPGTTSGATSTTAPDGELPTVVADQNALGIVPPDDPTCR